MAIATGLVVGSAIAAAGAVGAAAVQSSATKSAAQLQKESTDRALEYAKQQDLYRTATEANRYAAMTKGLQPAVSTGGAADARLATILGLPGPTAPESPTNPVGPGTPAPTYPTPAIPGTPSQPPSAVPRRGVPSGDRMVTMRAPDGSTQSVPAEHVAYYQTKGASVVDGGVTMTGSSGGPRGVV